MSETPASPSVSPGVSHVRIDDDRAGQRLDNFLMATLKGVPKSRIYRIIRDGQVRVNGRRAKQTQRLEAGDEVRIPPVRVASESTPPPVGQGLAERLERSLIHEDDWLYIYNKPAGLAVHGGSGISLGLIETLRVLHPAQAVSLELVHRLDRETSGAIMVARHRAFLRRLQRLMQDGGVEKRYWLLCRGFKGTQKTIEAPLLKQTHGNERVVKVSREGKASRTDFRLLERFGEVALVEATLATGRTHQIRVHAQFGGFPLLGDEKYGDPETNVAMAGVVGSPRMFLHARSLGLRHPETGQSLKVEAPLDEAFDQALSRLRGGAPVPAFTSTPRPARPESQGRPAKVVEGAEGGRAERRSRNVTAGARRASDDTRPAARQPAERKAGGGKPAGKKTAERKAADRKTADRKPTGRKSAGQKPAATGGRRGRSRG